MSANTKLNNAQITGKRRPIPVKLLHLFDQT